MTFYDAGLANTLSAIRVGYIGKQTRVVIPTTKFTRSVLDGLQRAGAIGYYEPSRTEYDLYNKHAIYLLYKNGGPVVKLRLISKNSQIYNIKYRAIREFTILHRGVLLLSTNVGILTNTEACARRVGGVALVWIEYL